MALDNIKENNVINHRINNVIQMARRSLEERNIRSLTKASGGRSYAVTIPIEFIKKLGWRSKQKLEMSLHRDRIIIKDWKE